MAGITINKTQQQSQLEISQETESDAETRQVPDNVSDNRSVGAGSSYSDFVNQWKNKLQEDEPSKEKAGKDDDVQSNHSRRS